MSYYYEAVVITRSELTEARNATIIDSVAEMIAGLSGKISRREYWGVRALAYRIGKNRRAHYNLINFEAPPDIVLELKNKFKLDEEVLRHLILRCDTLEHEPSVMMTAQEEETEEEEEGGAPRRRERKGPTSWQPGQAADDIRSRLTERQPFKRRDGETGFREERQGRGKPEETSTSEKPSSSPEPEKSISNDKPTGSSPDMTTQTKSDSADDLPAKNNEEESK